MSKYSEIKTAERKQQVDEMLNKFLEFIHHYEEQENGKKLSTFQDLLDNTEPVLESVNRCGDFGMVVHVSNVDPYYDEGGPCELLGFFRFDPDTNRYDKEDLDLLLLNFDTFTDPIWHDLPYPHNRKGFKWEVGE